MRYVILSYIFYVNIGSLLSCLLTFVPVPAGMESFPDRCTFISQDSAPF